jgi:hypothetical protein
MDGWMDRRVVEYAALSVRMVRSRYVHTQVARKLGTIDRREDRVLVASY